MLTLESLADEIFLEIFSHLFCADLANACLISRRLGAIGQICLYRAPIITNYRDTQDSLKLFLCTVIPNPVLAGYVRNIALNPHDSPIISERHELNELSELDSITAGLFLSTAGALGLGIEQSKVVLLLHLLPNLQALTLSRDWEYSGVETFIADLVFHRDNSTLPVGLRSLRHVYFEFTFDWNRGGLTPKLLMGLLSLPSIRTINMEIKDDFDLAGVSSPIAALTLRSGFITHESLTHILRVPRALTHFTLEDCYLTQADFHGPDFGRALRIVRATLQHLRLSLCDYMRMGPKFTGNGEPNTIGSLHDWPALRTVRCPLAVLLGQGPEVATSRLVDVLPAGIVELAVEGDCHWRGKEAADQIEAMLEQKDIGGLERLEVIIIGRKISREVDRLAVACAVAGAVLRLDSSWC